MSRFDQSYFDSSTFDGEEAEPVLRKKKMTSLQLDDVLGFVRLLQGAATENQVKLLAKQYDPSLTSTKLGADSETASTSHATATNSQIATTALFTTAENKKQQLYTDASNWCDQMVSALGKETPEGKAIRAIRTNLSGRGPNKPPATPTP